LKSLCLNNLQIPKFLNRASAIAALTAIILFRRNIGAEVSLFTGIEAFPTSAAAILLGYLSLLKRTSR
jgi:hypothetical protein